MKLFAIGKIISRKWGKKKKPKPPTAVAAGLAIQKVLEIKGQRYEVLMSLS